MQQKLTNQLKVIQSSDDPMKTPLPTSLAVSLVSGICPSTTPVRNKRLPLTKEIKKKKKDIRNNNSSHSSSSTSSVDRCGDVIAIESSMSAGKKPLTIEDLLKCPGCYGYFEKSVFLIHSFSCSSNIGLDHSHNISKNSLAAKQNPLDVVTTAEEQTPVNSLSLLSAANIPSPISISDSADEDDDDDADSCIVIETETENGVLARKEDPSDSTILVIPNTNSVSSSGRSRERLHIVNHDELPTTSFHNVIGEWLKNDNVSAGNSPCGGMAVPRGHYKKPSRPCPFCGVMQAKLTRHIQLKHKDEEQVKEALSLPPQLQRNAFNEMKKEGIHKENLRRLHQISESGTKLIKERNCLPMSTHACCPNCNERFPHSVFPQHLHNCGNLAEMGEATTYDFSSKDRDVFQPVFIEAGDNQLLSCLPTAVMKVESDITNESCGMVDGSSILDRGILEKTLPAVIQGSGCYKETCPSAETPISIDNRIEVSSNGVGFRKSDENVPDVCMHDVLQIQTDASVVHVEKLSIEHSKDTVTLNFGNSGRKMNSCKESGSAIQAENAVDLNIQYRDNSLTMENLQNSKLLNRQRDIQFASGSKGTNSFVSSSPSSLPHFEENSACLERDTPKQDSFPVGNEGLLFEERNQLSLFDDREELPYLVARHVFAVGQSERRGSRSADVLEDTDEERMHKSKTYKKPFRPCPFCGIMQAKLTRHIKLKHKNEERVKEALKLPAQEQRFAFNEFKREGIMLENLRHINTDSESDSLIHDRVPHIQVTMTVCPYCKGSYTKDAIWEHVRSCQVAPFQINISSWLLRQETDMSDLDLIQNLPEKVVSDKQVNPNLVVPPVSPLASSSSSLSISKRERRLPSFSDIEEKLVYGCSKELGLPSTPFRSNTEKNETSNMLKAPVTGSKKEYSERISFPCSQEMATSHIKAEPLTLSSPYSQELIKDPQNNFRRLLEENNQDCCLHFDQKAGLDPSQSNKPGQLASDAEHVAQTIGAESQKCSQTLDFLPFFTKIESDESSEPKVLQENSAVRILKRVDGLGGESPQTEDFSLVSIKKEIFVNADTEASLVQVLEMRAESPAVSISDPSDEDCSIVSSGSSVFVPHCSDQLASCHTNSQGLGMKTSNKSTVGKPQTYKKPSRPCLFCGIMQAKLSRHIKLKHKDEKRVQDAMQLSQPMQRHVFNQFKKEGIERENLRRLNDQTRSKELIAMRMMRPNSSPWTICLNCKVSIKKDTMKEHMNSCGTVPSDFSSSNCLPEQETPAMSRSVTLPNTGQVLTSGNTFLQTSGSKDSTLVSGNMHNVSSSLPRPPLSLEVKKENADLDGFENQDENLIQKEMENKKADGETILNQSAGPMFLESDCEPKYCPPKNLNALNDGQKQQPFTLESEVNPTSMQITYTPYCEPQNERELLKESYTKDAVRELYDLPANHIKKETEDSEACSAQSSLIFISDSSDDETIEDACSQYENTALPSIATNLAKNPRCPEYNKTGKNNGGHSYKKPFRPCPFCGIMQAKLSRHIQLKHKDEPRVRSALSLPQPFQRQAFSQFKKEGIMKENMRRISNPRDNKGLIPERLPPEKMLNVSCCGCGGLFPRDFISKHVLGCPQAVANLGLSTASTMMVFEDSCRPHVVGFKSNRDSNLSKEWVLKMRQVTSMELKDNDISCRVYQDQEKDLKDFQEKREKVEMSLKTNSKNGFIVDSFKMSQAIEKASVQISSRSSEHVQKPDCLAGVQDNPKETNSRTIPFVNSKLLDEDDLIHKSDNDFTVVNLTNQKNLPDIIPSRQNTMNMSPPLMEIDLTADISVSKIRKPPPRRWGFYRGGIQKGKSYKRPFRPCPFCGVMQVKLIRHIKLRHKKKRPVRAVFQLSPPLQLKAFRHFRKEGFLKDTLRHNDEKAKAVSSENSQKVTERQTQKKSVGGIRPHGSLPKASRFKSYRKYFSKTTSYHHSEHCHKSKTETDCESYPREDPAFRNKSLCLASSFASADSELLKNCKSFVTSEKGQSTEQQDDGYISEGTLGTDLGTEHLNRVKLRLPDVTSHTEKKGSKSGSEEIERRDIVRFASFQHSDDCSSNNQSKNLADGAVLAKADTSTEKEPRKPMLSVKTEKISFLKKDENLNSNPQSLPTLTAPLTSNPPNPNSDRELIAPNTSQSTKIPQFPLKACGSSVLSDTENGNCLPSISVLGVASLIPTNQAGKNKDVSLNSTCLTAACLEFDGGPYPTHAEEARHSIAHENAAPLSAKQQKNVEKSSLREGYCSDRAESKCCREEDCHAEISIVGLKNGIQIETLKTLQETSDSSQTKKVEATTSASSVEGTCFTDVGTKLTSSMVKGAGQASLPSELESAVKDSKVKTPSTFSTSEETPCPAVLIKTEISLPSSPVLTSIVTKSHSKESGPICPLKDIAKENSDIEQELAACKGELLNSNNDQHLVFCQMPQPEDEGDCVAEIVCLETDKTTIPVEQAPIVPSLDSISDNKDCTANSQNILRHPGEEIPAGKGQRSHDFCEGTNKNGRSASGGNNGGGGGSSGGGSSGGGSGGGGGGQMSSAQNSSRDSGSSTTSGRNGTGSCSFGRGGSTNRKPPTPCPFCGVRQAKLKRHIQLRHKDEERVKKALQLPPNLQRDVFHQFKEEGLANERNRVKDNSGATVSSRVGSGNRSSGSSSSSTATSSGISSGGGGSSSSVSGGGGGSSSSGRGTPTAGNIGSSGVGGTTVRCSSTGSSRGGIETSKVECTGSGANIVAPHDPSALKVLCPLCDTYYEKDVLQMHMIGCSSALSHFNASDWLTGPVPLGASDSELDADFLSERSSDLVLDPLTTLTTPLLKEEYESPVASCSVGSLSSYKEFSGYMVTHPQQQMPRQQQQQQQQQQPQHPHHQQHPGQNFPGSGNSFIPNLEECQQMPPNYGMEMGQNQGPGNAATVSNPYAVPAYHGSGIGHENPGMVSATSWNQRLSEQRYQQQQMYHHHQQLLQTQHPHPHQQQPPLHHHHQQQQQHQPQQQQPPPPHPPPQQHLQPPHHHTQQQHLQTQPALPQQPPPQSHHQRPMPADPTIMYMKSPKQEFPPSSSSFHTPDNFMLPSPQMASQISDPSLHHRPPQLYSPNSGHGKRASSTASPHDYGTPMFNSPTHPQMSPSGGPGYHYAPHHQVPTMPPPSPSPRSCGNFPHMDDGGYQQMMSQHCMPDQGMMRSPPVAPHLPPPPPNRHAMMQMDATQPHGNIPMGSGDNNNNNRSTGSPYLATRQIGTGGNTTGNMAANTANNYRSPVYHSIGPGTVSPSPNSSFHHSPVASPSLSSTSSSSSKNSVTYHYPTSTAVSSTAPGSSFSGPMYGLPDLSSSSSIGDNCRLSYESMGHSSDGIGLSQQGHQLQPLPPQQLPPPPPPPQQQSSLLQLQPLPSLMDNPPPASLLPSMPQMTPPRNHSASTTPAASGGSMAHPPFAGGSGSSSSSSNQIDPNCIIGGSCDPTCGDGDKFSHQAGNMSSLHEGGSKDLADEISAAIDSHEDSSCGSSTTSGSGLSTAAGGAEWNSCSGSACPSGTGNNGSTPALFTATTLDSNNASNSSGSSSCGGNSPRGYSKLRNYKKPARPCPFCGVMQAKLTRHIKLKHKEDKRVVEALGLPQPLKRQAFSQFKKEGIMKQARTSSGGPSSSSADPPSS